jgi:hypothetical protein
MTLNLLIHLFRKISGKLINENHGLGVKIRNFGEWDSFVLKTSLLAGKKQNILIFVYY